MFVILAGLVFFAWGNIFSIFPALTSDHFGRKYATTNYALLYTAKGAAAFFVPIGSIIALRTGSWSTTLVVAAIANIIAALIMLVLLRPLRLRELRRQETALAPADSLSFCSAKSEENVTGPGSACADWSERDGYFPDRDLIELFAWILHCPAAGREAQDDDDDCDDRIEQSGQIIPSYPRIEPQKCDVSGVIAPLKM